MKKISIVIPIYNEEVAIEKNVRLVLKALDDNYRDAELVLVNDGSTDSTLDTIQRLAEGDKRIEVVSYGKNRGRGYALKRGFKQAVGDYIITTESDLNWGSDIIFRFAEELDNDEADIIVASPHMKGGKMISVPFFRWFLSYMGNKVFALTMPQVMTMSTGMTRGYKREVLDVLDLESEGKELHVEILNKAFDLGFYVKEIPATLNWERKNPSITMRKSHFKLGMILNHLLLSIIVRPFLLFGGVGFLMIGLGTIGGIYLLILSITGTPVSGRPLLLFSSVMVLVGLLILLFGFLSCQIRGICRQLLRIQKDIRKK